MCSPTSFETLEMVIELCRQLDVRTKAPPVRRSSLNDVVHIVTGTRPLRRAFCNVEHTIAPIWQRRCKGIAPILAPADVASITAWVVDVPKVDGNGGGVSGFAIVVTLSGRRW